MCDVFAYLCIGKQRTGDDKGRGNPGHRPKERRRDLANIGTHFRARNRKNSERTQRTGQPSFAAFKNRFRYDHARSDTALSIECVRCSRFSLAIQHITPERPGYALSLLSN